MASYKLKYSGTKIDELLDTVNDIFDLIYPVGSIYMSVNNTNPSILFGGTWTQIQDRFLLAAGGTYTNGNTGGEATHTLTTTEMPSHAHGLNSHKHSVGAHAHGLNSHTHGVGSYATGSAGDHSHNRIYDGVNTYGLTGNVFGGSGSGTTLKAGTSTISITNSSSLNHTHSISGTSGAASGNTANSSAFDSGVASGDTASSGSGGAHNNMPPYLVVYIWKRTA